MLATALKGVLAHKLRLALSAAAVVLGVAFVAGSLVFTATLGKTFTDLFSQVSADVTISPKTDFEDLGAGDAATVPQSVLDTVRSLPGVAAAAGTVSAQGVQIIGSDGKVVGGGGGAPGLGGDFSGAADGLSSLHLVQGRAPQGTGEVVVDSVSAKKGKLRVGAPVRLVMPSGPPVRATLVGVVRFGSSGNLAGATITAWDPQSAQKLLLPKGGWTDIGVKAASGVDNRELEQRVQAAIGSGAGYEVRTQKEQADAAASDIQQGLKFINIFLLVFAGIALFVGSFMILNTFSMLVAQRQRELALLRALGASRRQVTRSVLVEAVVVGVFGSTVGLGLGVLLAVGLKALFGAFGLELGNAPLVFSLSTVLWSYAVGVVVTIVAAYFPARRAAKVPPVAAMGSDVSMAPKGLRVRGLVGGAITILGIGGLVAGLASGGGQAAAFVGAGALLVLIGVAVLSPVLSRPVIGVLAATYPRLFGTVGRLGRDNALRNPRRTASTASALMIGLALVGGMGTLAASVNASVEALIDKALGADFVVTGPNQTAFSPEVATRLRGLPGVAAVSENRYATARVAGSTVFFNAVDPATLDQAIKVSFTSGSAAALQAGTFAVDQPTATKQKWTLGTSVPVAFPSGSKSLRLGAVYAANSAVGSYLTSLGTLASTGATPADNIVYVVAAPDADLAALHTGVDSALAAYPNLDALDQTEFKDQQQSQINQLLYFIYALLALSIGIAVLGIVNTLALSVIERTREIGLLRAVGMARRQLRRMIVLESVVISTFGALLGLAVGVGFGVALQRSLSGQGIDTLAIPVTRLLLFLVLSALVGVLAALWPARRAARTDVLRAITSG